ncbi:MAG TPA: RICIN domain-containing protein [Actinoplanes sp.]|nr:RICIN domain-containing protein [Actinoplanes sp.]
MRRPSVLFLALVAAVIPMSASAAPAAPARDGRAEPVDVQLVAAGSDWCLTSYLTELPCAPTGPYRWRFRPVGGGAFELLSVRADRCLSMPGGTRVEGARAGLASCAALPSRRWELRDSAGATAEVVNTRSGLCLRIESGVAVQGSCTRGPSRWTVRVLHRY